MIFKGCFYGSGLEVTAITSAQITSVTRSHTPYLTARELRKFSLAVCPGRGRNGFGEQLPVSAIEGEVKDAGDGVGVGEGDNRRVSFLRKQER